MTAGDLARAASIVVVPTANFLRALLGAPVSFAIIIWNDENAVLGCNQEDTVEAHSVMRALLAAADRSEEGHA